MNLNRSTLQAVALIGQIGCSIAIFLIGAIAGGILLDKFLGTTPLFIIVGVFVGFALAGYSTYRVLPTGSTRKTDNSEDGKEQP